MLQNKKPTDGAIWEYHKQYRHFRVLRIISMISAGIIVALVAVALYFTYRSVFSTIENAEAALQIQHNLSTDIINFGQYEAIETAWDQKYAQDPLTISRDPFSLGQSVSSIEPTTTTTPSITPTTTTTQPAL